MRSGVFSPEAENVTVISLWSKKTNNKKLTCPLSLGQKKHDTQGSGVAH